MLIVAGVLVVYGVIAVLHQRAVWPFNVTPKVSSSESSWTKALVRDVPADCAQAVEWTVIPLDRLPGRPVALADYGLSPEHLAPYVEPTHSWTDDREARLRTLLEAAIHPGRALLVYRVRGTLDTTGVTVKCTPVAALYPDTLIATPKIHACHMSESGSTSANTSLPQH